MTDETPVAVADAAVATPDAPAAPEPVEETVTMTKAEADALRRRVAEGEKAARKFEADKKAAEEAQAAQQGEYQKLAEERAAELERVRGEAERTAREARITRLAGKHKFIDPSDVISRITADEAADDASVELALERVAKASPHLVAKDAPAAPEIGVVHAASAPGTPGAPAGDGKPQPPAGKPAVQSLDEWEALPQAERLARMAEADWLAAHEQK